MVEYSLTPKGAIVAYLITNGKRSIDEIARFLKLTTIEVESLLAEINQEGYVELDYSEATQEWFVK